MLEGLKPGHQLLRKELHERFGGRRQGGIGPSRGVPVVLFFTDPATGHKHGYYDGWGKDKLFHYVGEGQRGDQQLIQGNKAILNHRSDGRTLEGFRAHGPMVTYLGQFELVSHYFTDAHETGDDSTVRQVVVFRLRPLGEVPVELPQVPISPELTATVQVVKVEEQHTERAFVNPNREPYEMERREAGLVHRYRQYLQRKGHDVGRLQVVPPGESRPLYSDLWDRTAKELIEAKGTVTRDALRMAVGQLLDYGRFVNAESRAVLVPSCPREDLVTYLHEASIAVIYPDADGWTKVTPDPGYTIDQ